MKAQSKRSCHPACVYSSDPLAGMIWAEVKEIWSQGPGEYLLEPWNFLDFGMLAIFLASFSCRFSILRQANLAQTFVHARYTTLNNIQLPPEIEYFTKGEHVHTPAQSNRPPQTDTSCLSMDFPVFT